MLVLLCVAAAVTGLLVTAFRPTWPVVGAALLAIPAGAVIEAVAHGRLERAVIGVVGGVSVAACACVGSLGVRTARARQAYIDRGWAVARAEAREQDTRVREAVLRERQRMAGEIHDELGHRLTLLAVQAGRLSLDESLPETVRRELGDMRAAAATASRELGQTVQLLDRSHVSTAPAERTVEDVVVQARRSGLPVENVSEPGLETQLGDFTRAAVIRAVQESLTNAAKHAPGQPVRVELRHSAAGGSIELRVSNSLPVDVLRKPPVGSGYGLGGVEHRARLLGGSFAASADEDSGEFRLRMTLPVDAVPGVCGGDGPIPSDRETTVVGERAVSRRRRSSTAARFFLIPALLAGLAVAVTVGYFVYATSTSIMPPEDFEQVRVGAAEEEVSELLPATGMLEAPRESSDAQDGQCHYYEASRSFFERDDVYRICFDQGVVSAATTIPAP